MWAHIFPSVCLGCERLLRHRPDPRDRALPLCTRCLPQQARLPDALAEHGGVRAQWSYDGPLGRAVVSLKFAGALALAGPLGGILAMDPRLRVDDRGVPWDLAVPVPLHWRRRLVRGFDQTEELARWALLHATREHGSAPTLGRRLVRRIKSTQPQTELDAREREQNVHAAFRVRRPELVRDRRIVMIDDVTTTGATARACAAALRSAGAKSVDCLALLRAL